MTAVANGDVQTLTRIPELGKKTAERLIVELRGKLDLTAEAESKIAQNPRFTEAAEALENLGYDRSIIVKILEPAPKNASAEELVKFFLSSNA